MYEGEMDGRRNGERGGGENKGCSKKEGERKRGSRVRLVPRGGGI